MYTVYITRTVTQSTRIIEYFSDYLKYSAVPANQLAPNPITIFCAGIYYRHMKVNTTIFPFVLSIFAILDLVVHAERHCVCDALSLSSSAPQNLNDSLRHWSLYLGGLSSQEVAKLPSISLGSVHSVALDYQRCGQVDP